MDKEELLEIKSFIEISIEREEDRCNPSPFYMNMAWDALIPINKELEQYETI